MKVVYWSTGQNYLRGHYDRLSHGISALLSDISALHPGGVADSGLRRRAPDGASAQVWLLHPGHHRQWLLHPGHHRQCSADPRERRHTCTAASAACSGPAAGGGAGGAGAAAPPAPALIWRTAILAGGGGAVSGNGVIPECSYRRSEGRRAEEIDQDGGRSGRRGGAGVGEAPGRERHVWVRPAGGLAEVPQPGHRRLQQPDPPLPCDGERAQV